MVQLKEIKIKNQTYYFFNGMINIEIFDPNLTKNRQKVVQKHWYLLHWIKIKNISDYENIYSVNPLYLTIGQVDGHIEEKNGSKYLKMVNCIPKFI